MSALELRCPPQPSARFPQIEELRGLAMIFIVLYHAGGVLVWSNYFHGDLGVDIFVIISGLGLMLSSRQDTFVPFMVRRLKRLIPLYWLILTVFLVCNTHFLQHKYSAFNIVVHYLGIHDLFGDFYAFGIDDSFWFISFILFLYVCFYFLRPVLSRAPDRFIFLAGLISAVVALACFFGRQGGLMGHIGFRTPSFFFGMAAGELIRRGRLDLPLTGWLALGLLFLGYGPYTQGVTFYSTPVAISIMAGYVILLRPRLSAANPLTRSLGFVGRHSYEIFLLHQPLIREYNIYLQGRWFNIAVPSPLSIVVGMAAGFAVTLILAVELRKLQDRFFRV